MKKMSEDLGFYTFGGGGEVPCPQAPVCLTKDYSVTKAKDFGLITLIFNLRHYFLRNSKNEMVVFGFGIQTFHAFFSLSL